jgi:uncharacterized membrane protein
MADYSNLSTIFPLPHPTADDAVPFIVANGLPELRPPDLNNSLIHLYRGELGRQISYRQRLDTSTQYAVTIASTLTVLSFAYSAVPSTVHLLIAFFVCVFLVLESRRYLYYQVVRYRVRQLETGYYGRYILGPKWQPPPAAAAAPPAPSAPSSVPSEADELMSRPRASSEADVVASHPPLNGPQPRVWGASHRSHSIVITPADEDNPNVWMPRLLQSIMHASLTMTLFHAACIRLQRVYMGLLLGVYAGWIMKVQYVDEWDPQVYPVVIVGFMLAVVFVWTFWLFPITRTMTRFQPLYWTHRRYWTDQRKYIMDEADV